MAHGFKESDFQHGVFIPYLTAPPPAGLDWVLGKPADIAHAVAYLASPEAGYVTGQELHVNGGMYM